MTTTAPVTTVTATDGVALAVHRYNEFDAARPTILAIHGYPDNHHVWDGVAELLADRYNMAAFDVRGAGDSGEPADRAGYRFPQLVSDIGTVIDHLGVDEAKVTDSASFSDVVASVSARFSCAPVMAPRTFSALSTIASRSFERSSIKVRMRRSLSA